MPLDSHRSFSFFLFLLFIFLSLPPHLSAQGGGQITFQTTTPQGEPVLWQTRSDSGSSPENLTLMLDAISTLPGRHRGPIKISPDGMWYVFTSERFDSSSQGWPGLTIAPTDLQSAETIRSGGQTIHGEGGQATAGGMAVVYVDAGGPHQRDLFIVQREVNGWSSPLCITTQSRYAWNYWPVLRSDSAKVLFDAGPTSFPSEAICEVNLDGTGFRVRLTKDSGPSGFSASPSAHSPAPAPDGSILFEAEWGGVERIWKLAPGDTVPSLVSAALTNDNSPAVLPDGRIVSLWLGSSGGNGLHEIKVMTSDGSAHYMLTSSASPFPEVDDIGLGTGPSSPPTSAVEQKHAKPTFELAQNYPNPFNPSTVIRYGLPMRSTVRLEVYDILGKRVATLVDGEREARYYEVRWEANVATGMYLYKLEAVGVDDQERRFVQVRKMLLLR